jgi:hypothetical protein
MATPPQEPTFDKARFAAVPWLSKFWELLLPFFRETAAGMNRGLTVRDNLASVVVEGENRPTHTQPADVETPVNHFIETGPIRPSWVQVLAEPISEGSLPSDFLVPVLPEWMPSAQGERSGVTLVRLRGLTAGRRYRLTVTVFGG